MNERLKKLRKSLDMTQQEFADRINVSRNTVATYEMGRSGISAAVVSLICKEFNINEDWLRYGIGDMYKAVNDETASFIADLLIDVDNPFYSVIESILKTYSELDDKSKKVLEDFSKQFIKNIKNDG